MNAGMRQCMNVLIFSSNTLPLVRSLLLPAVNRYKETLLLAESFNIQNSLFETCLPAGRFNIQILQYFIAFTHSFIHALTHSCIHALLYKHQCSITSLLTSWSSVALK